MPAARAFMRAFFAGVAENDMLSSDSRATAGGPAMLRAAAKNVRDVTVVVRPADYDLLSEGLAAADYFPRYRSPI